jgi:hypothetical protein
MLDDGYSTKREINGGKWRRVVRVVGERDDPKGSSLKSRSHRSNADLECPFSLRNYRFPSSGSFE